MEKFVQLTAVAARLPIVNLDTDRILSAVFLKRTGLAQSLFHEIRLRGDGSEERLACD
jgi:3-isopropylmalate/(R)-2-methylmalate dehydratase small subunit